MTSGVARFTPELPEPDLLPHMSLDRENRETPAQAYERKMPPAGETVIDGQTREEYHVR